jgi:hypothetical protein
MGYVVEVEGSSGSSSSQFVQIQGTAGATPGNRTLRITIVDVYPPELTAPTSTCPSVSVDVAIALNSTASQSAADISSALQSALAAACPGQYSVTVDASGPSTLRKVVVSKPGGHFSLGVDRTDIDGQGFSVGASPGAPMVGAPVLVAMVLLLGALAAMRLRAWRNAAP